MTNSIVKGEAFDFNTHCVCFCFWFVLFWFFWVSVLVYKGGGRSQRIRSKKRMNLLRIADKVYGEIKLAKLVAQISATAEFNRLDDIRQLGGCAFVYPSATHTRREHSLGVSYLSGVAVKHLRSLYPHLVDEDDILCVQVAGIIHDLGHGPFSHLFEDYVGNGWSHEEMAIRIFYLILERNSDIRLLDHFRIHSIDENLSFIRLLVIGFDESGEWPPDVGRGREKQFLTEIVHSRRTGIDMDKIDYLCRDSLSVFGATNSLSIMRIVGSIRVTEKFVCAFDESLACEISDIFMLRAKMHRQVYQHRAVVVVEGLLMNLMRSIDKNMAKGNTLRDIANDPSRFVNLVDSSILRCYVEGEDQKVALASLYQRPWMERLPITLSLNTGPRCRRCRAATVILDSHCPSCGKSTCDREGSEEGGLLIPTECGINSDTISSLLMEKLGRGDVYVHIVDIVCGYPVSVTDPHGRKWRDYDPLKNIIFLSGESPIHMSGSSFLIPKVCHFRNVHCYLPTGSSQSELDTAVEAFHEVCDTFGVFVETIA